MDTNPYAWAHLASSLPLHQAIANLLVFINAHLAFSNANRVAVIAAHLQRAEFLYPAPPSARSVKDGFHDGDIEMADASSINGAVNGTDDVPDTHLSDANFYHPFAAVSAGLTRALGRLLKSTLPHSNEDLTANPTTSLAGALTLALTYTNKTQLSLAPLTNNPRSSANPAATSSGPGGTQPTAPSTLTSRILVLSASAASPAQYIPLMNAIFAAQRQRLAIDVLALTPRSSSFLQQAADATHGIYMPLEHPHGLLQTLFQAFLPSLPSRAFLIPPGQVDVDFRAACFCHRKVVDVGFVCSICLSIFCEPPEGAVCLTCGTQLRMGNYGATPAVVMRKKKKKRPRENDERAGTPASGK